MRGSGKTAVGCRLAQKLDKNFIETDQLIVAEAKMTIPQIVDKFGWQRFRQIEELIIKNVSGTDNSVISTGGGVITRENNIKVLKRNGIIIWLRANIETLIKRVGNDTNRPLLTGSRSIKKDMLITFNQRKLLYRKAADFTVFTEMKNIHQVVEQIIELIGKKESND